MASPAPGLPDVDDPAAVAAWVAGIEQESGRISARQRLVLDVAEASHALHLARLAASTGWHGPAARRRAWTVLALGWVIVGVEALAMVATSHRQAGFMVLPVAALVWLAVAGHEVAGWYRGQARAREAHASALAHAQMVYDRAKARLLAHEEGRG